MSRNIDTALPQETTSPTDDASGSSVVNSSNDHANKVNLERIRQRLAELNSIIDALRQSANAVGSRERVGAGSPNWPEITQFSTDFIKNFGSKDAEEQYRSMTPFSVLTQFGPPTEVTDNTWIWATNDPHALSGSASMRIEFSGTAMSKVNFPRQ